MISDPKTTRAAIPPIPEKLTRDGRRNEGGTASWKMSKRKRYPVMAPVNGEYRLDDLFRSKPKFAVINMEENQSVDAIGLTKTLFGQGVKNVRFCDDISKLPEVQAMLKMRKNELGQLNPVNGNGAHVEEPKMEVKVEETKVEEKVEENKEQNDLIQTPAVPTPSLTHPDFDPLKIPNILNFLQKVPNDFFTPMLHQTVHSPSPTQSEVGGKRWPGEKDKPLPEEFLTCVLCPARIQISKESTIRAHVKTHLGIRAFKCTDCSFGSESWKTVMSHMQTVHQNYGQPANEEKEREQDLKIWTDKLFPGRFLQMEILRTAQMRKNILKGNVQNGMNSQTAQLMAQKLVQEIKGKEEEKKQATILSPAQFLTTMNEEIQKMLREPAQKMPPVKKYKCTLCTKEIKCYSGYELPSDGPLSRHLRNHHKEDLVAYECETCGWKSEMEFKVRRHIAYRHWDAARKLKALPSRRSGNWKLYLKKYFGELVQNRILELDEEEVKNDKMDKDKTTWCSMEMQRTFGIPMDSNWQPPYKKFKGNEEETVTIE
ncbi:hypothetical protein L5515_015239 [Caenorhabditis briggsae]|uniref:C2H2-type domain-containing protein n=1 Tax=Caenorhabditis briggsae TaxID=6238 RepID=A0AAE9J7X0_CAEBR|nr:hypothetical protein L5515_015239 [Caenorhabditis briggsae]